MIEYMHHICTEAAITELRRSKRTEKEGSITVSTRDIGGRFYFSSYLRRVVPRGADVAGIVMALNYRTKRRKMAVIGSIARTA